MQFTSAYYPKGKVKGLVFQGFKELRVHLEVLGQSAEFPGVG